MFFISGNILANHIKNHLKYARSWHLNIFMGSQLPELSSVYFSQCRRRHRVSAGVEVSRPLSMFFIFRSILANHIRNDLKYARSWHLDIFMGSQLPDLSSAYFSQCLRRHCIPTGVEVSNPLSMFFIFGSLLAKYIRNYLKCARSWHLDIFMGSQLPELSSVYFSQCRRRHRVSAGIGVSHPLSMFFIFRSILANHIANDLKYARSWHLDIFMGSQLPDLSSAYFSQCLTRHRISAGVEVSNPLSMFFIF